METPSEIAQSLGGRYSKDLNHCLKSCIDFDPVKRPDARALFSEIQKHMRANPEYQEAVQNHLLLMGACEGDFEKVLTQLEKGTCIDTPLSTDEETPLHKAIRYGHLALVQFLLEKGADVSKKNKERQTALHVAAASALEDHGDLLVEILLEKGSSMAIFDDHNRTPLHVAAANNQVEVVKKLHECGMDLESTTRDSRRSRAVHIAAENGHLGLVEELEASGADIQAARAGDETAIQLAAEGGHIDLLKFFLARGTKPDTPFGRDRLTALDQAVKSGHEEAVRILLLRGASCRTKTASGETPLHFAAATNSYQIIRLLVVGIDSVSMPKIPSDQLADIEAKTNDKRTALHVAVYSRQSSAVDELLILGSDYNAKTADGDTPLHHAALRNSLEIALALINKGASVSARGPRQATPLHYAAYRGHVDMVKFLVTNDKSMADLEERTHSGDTILHLAAYFGHTKLAVQLLKNLNFKIDLVNKNGETALHQAAAQGKEDVLRELLSFGADFSIRSRSGQTARQMAERSHHSDCTKRLVRLEHG